MEPNFKHMKGVKDQHLKKTYPIFYDSLFKSVHEENISLPERIWLYKNNLKTKPLCKNCQKNKLNFRNFNLGYRKFCSKKCYYKSISGKNGSNWNGGFFYRKGYKFILCPNHPFKNAIGYVRQSRLIAEKCLSRYLTKLEIIHHINGIRDDNRPENLYLFATTGKHTKYHHRPYSLISNL